MNKTVQGGSAGGTVASVGTPDLAHSAGTVVVNAGDGFGSAGAGGTMVVARSSQDGGDYLAALRSAAGDTHGYVGTAILPELAIDGSDGLAFQLLPESLQCSLKV